MAHRHGLPLVVDNTFGTPYLGAAAWNTGPTWWSTPPPSFWGATAPPWAGVIVDGGNFDWAASGRYPAIAAPNPSYHGVSASRRPPDAPPLTAYVRAVLLRDTGAAISPFAAFLLLAGD